MLRQLRHISEGHYYGLRVTNNAEVEHLNRELRTLDACKNVQSHCYRKEEKDLVNTLKRLKKSKEHHVEEHFGRHSKHDSGHSTAHGHAHRSKHHPSRESSAHPHGGQVVGSTLRMPQPRKPLSDHVIMPTVGSDIHRTAGFIDCVICNLPRSSHVKGTEICTCDKGPDKGTHHMHPPAIHDDRSREEYLSPRERRDIEMQNRKEAKEHSERNGETKHTQEKSLDDEDRMFLKKLQREMTEVIEQPSANPRDFSYEKRAHSPRKGDNAYDEKGHFLSKPRRGSQLDDERFRTRQDSIDEEGPYTVWNRHRRESIEEHDFRKRGPSFDNGIRERNESVGGESYYSVGELRSRTSTIEDTNGFRKTYKVPYNMHDAPSQPERQLYQPRHQSSHRFHPREETHLPQLAPQKKENTEAFHGLIHPDNIINHHHYLPYEVDKPSGKRRHHDHHSRHDDHHKGHDDHHSRHDDHHRHHDNHHKRHLQGYYVHKYDHTGARQIAHIPLGANVHIAEMIERQHEPDSNHFALLSNLRQLLSVYHSLEDTAPKYPWPSPPSTDMTPEEFQKLKDCRYLRLPKSMEDAAIESPVFR